MNNRHHAPTVVVLGSVHMDLIASAARMPGRGESVGEGVFAMSAGGKAGNQACQFVLAGAYAHVITRLGKDAFGETLLDDLTRRGVDTVLVAQDPTTPTGASTVFAVEGDYSSIIAPGAKFNRLPQSMSLPSSSLSGRFLNARALNAW